MEKKKTKMANLENKRGLFFQSGLIVSIGLALAAFEWEQSVQTARFDFGTGSSLFEVETTVITREKEKIVEPPKPVYKIDIVDDLTLTDILDMEDFIFDVDDVWDLTYTPEEPESVPVYFAEEMPKYKGSDVTLFWKEMQSLLDYPKMAEQMGIEGTVVVGFVINEKGELTNIEFLRSIDLLLVDEVKRVLNNSEKWTPGKQRGRPVKVKFNMSFKFVLN